MAHNVVVKGTNMDAFTDFDGKYMIKAQLNDTLAFSWLGYITQEIPVKTNVVNVQLALNPEALITVTVSQTPHTSSSHCIKDGDGHL